MSEYDQFEEEEFTTQFNGRVVARIFAQAKPYWKWILGFLCFIALTSVVDSIFTWLGKLIIDQGILAGNKARVIQLVTYYGGLAVLQATTMFGFIYLAGVLGERIHYDIRRKLFNHLQELSFSYFDRTPVGWIMSRVTSDAGRMADLVTWGLIDVTWATLNVTTAMIFMMNINWRLALAVLAIIPIMLVVAIWFRKRILTQFREVRKLNSKLTGTYNENITGVRVVKALVREERNLQEFGQESFGLYKAAYRAAWLSALFLPSVQLISAFGVGAVVWYGGFQVQIGSMTLGGIQAFLSYIGFMMWPIQDLAHVFAEMQRSVASAERVFSLMDARPDIVDREGATELDTIRGQIQFEHVDFYYEQDNPVLSDLNLSVRAGERIALVGPTGGGKSTIVNLICRFYEPKHGTIRINGQDYTELTQHAIQSRIGMVLQTPHLFSGTIRDNIRYGRLGATDAEVEEAARIAYAHDFITNMEKGYDEDVGEGGVLLSVGQKQLISLARAVLASPDIFIMDEATSSVDTLTEAQIQKGMEAIMHNRTSFVIAHRLSTIKNADRILVIENGHIAEMGTHHELIRARGHYYSLYTKQFRQKLEHDYELLGDEQREPVSVGV